MLGSETDRPEDFILKLHVVMAVSHLVFRFKPAPRLKSSFAKWDIVTLRKSLGDNVDKDGNV